MIETEDSVEILEAPGQAEGESGSETIGFSTFGAQRINDAQKRRARPINTRFAFNRTNNAAQSSATQPPVAYWGNFVTLFDGTIVAGTRLDGQGTNFSTTPVNYNWTDGTGTRSIINTGKIMPPVYLDTIVGRPGGLIGLDVFFRTSMTNVVVVARWVNSIGGIQGFTIVNNKNPIVIDFGTIITRLRPEGYNPGENGIQVFFLPRAGTTLAATPAGFINPNSVGAPNFLNVDNFNNGLDFDITP